MELFFNHSLFVIGAGTGLTFAFYLVARHFKSSIFTDPLNLSILLLAHLMDASSTYIGISKLGYFSKHVVPAYLIQLTGTALVMYPLKLIIFIGVIYLLDTQFSTSPTGSGNHLSTLRFQTFNRKVF